MSEEARRLRQANDAVLNTRPLTDVAAADARIAELVDALRALQSTDTPGTDPLERTLVRQLDQAREAAERLRRMQSAFGHDERDAFEQWFLSSYGPKPTAGLPAVERGTAVPRILRAWSAEGLRMADAMELWEAKHAAALAAWHERHHRGKRGADSC
jgi:hypothetical protein